MNKIIFIHKYWRSFFRRRVDDLVCFVGWSKDHWYEQHRIFNKVTNMAYGIDNNIEYFIRNGKVN